MRAIAPLALFLLAACARPGADDTSDTDPATADGDDDGLTDAAEEAAGCDPSDADSDDDGVPDGAEVAGGTDCANPDTDGDDLCDGPRRDGDGDGLSPESPCNLSEGFFGCDPTAADGDGGGTPDGVEALLHGTDCAAAGDDVPVCVPNFGFETWDGDVAPGFSAGTGGSLSESSQAHTGDASARFTWTGQTADLVFHDALSSPEQALGNCVFRAWVFDDDPDVSALAVARHVEPDGQGGWTTTSESPGVFSSGDGGWQEVLVEFACAGTFQPVLRLSSFGSGGTVQTDDWVVHAADHDPFVMWDAQTDPGAVRLQGPDGPVDLYARLQSSSTFEGTLYVSAPWADANADRGVIVLGAAPSGVTADPPWDKAGTVPDANGRLVALMQEGSDPNTNQWSCEWAEWAPFGSAVWVSQGTTCSGGQSNVAGLRLEGTYTFTGSSSEPWPEAFWFAVGSWATGSNGALIHQEQIPEGDGDGSIEDSELLGPYTRADLLPGVVEPCAGLGDPDACPPPGAPGASNCPSGNLLSDGGFEDAGYGSGAPDAAGEWGGDLASIEQIADCLQPTEGTDWLKLSATDALGASDDDRADAIQLLDAAPLRGRTLKLSADGVRKLEAGDDAFFGVEARLYDGVPDDFPIAWARGEGTVLGAAGAHAAEVPGKPWGRARPEVEFTVPAGDGDAYLAVIVFALEDATNDTSGTELPAHFVDDACLVAP